MTKQRHFKERAAQANAGRLYLEWPFGGGASVLLPLAPAHSKRGEPSGVPIWGVSVFPLRAPHLLSCGCGSLRHRDKARDSNVWLMRPYGGPRLSYKDTFCSVLWGLLSGPLWGTFPWFCRGAPGMGLVRRLESPGGKSGCHDHSTRVYQALTVCSGSVAAQEGLWSV